MARINVTRLPLPTDKYDRSQQDILIREQYYMDTMKNCINYKSANIYNRRQHCIDYQKKYREENKELVKQKYTDKYHYQASWGGDKRNHNNLLKIDINLFHDR